MRNSCSWARGYYDYDNPLPTSIPGIEDFQGKLIHPQFWPEELDYTNKKIVIIGSGATAVTLLPSLLKNGASHVTILQRSPSCFLTQKSTTPSSSWLINTLNRYMWLLLPTLFLKFCRAFPTAARNLLSGYSPIFLSPLSPLF